MSIQTLIEHGPFIGGTAEPLSGEQREITNPGTGELVGRVTDSTAQDADRAVAAAPRRIRDWARLGYADRGKIIHACAEAFEAHVDELTPILVAEQGKTIREAKIELHKAADTLEHYAGLSRQVRGISVHNVDPGVEARTLRRPLGVVAAIVPWNFPTTLLCNKLGPALLAGNTVVAKPADTTPFTTLRLAEIFHEAGLPAGVFNVLPGAGAVVGEALVRHPLRPQGRLHRLHAGRRARARARGGRLQARDARARRLGPDDHLRRRRPQEGRAAPPPWAASTTAARPAWRSSGCTSSSRVADEVIEAVAAKAKRLRVGHRRDPDSQLGPMHTESQRAIMERQIAESGGEILAGGGRPEGLDGGWFHEPTVVVEPGRDSPMAREEVFGPALPIWRVKDLDEAIELANDSPFGLGSSLWTTSLDRAERVAAELDCGYTWINSPTKVYDELPFGGLKASGYGKEHGSEALDYYTDSKSVVVKRTL